MPDRPGVMAQVPEDMSPGACPRGGAALLAALALPLLAAFPYAEATRNANERPRLLQAASLVERGSWRIDGLGLDPGPDVARAPSGALYPNKPPGTSVVAALGYALARATAGAEEGGVSGGTGGRAGAREQAAGEPGSGSMSEGTGDGASANGGAGRSGSVSKDMSEGAGRRGPTLRAVTWWARLLGGVLPTLVLCGLLWRSLAPRFGARAAALAIGLYALATPAAAYAHLLYGHQLAACLLWAGLLALVRAREAGRPGLAALGGALAGAAVLVEYTAAFAGLAAAGLVIGLVRARQWATAAAATAGALVPAGLLMAYHAAVFGGPLKTGYHHSATAAFAEKHGEGLLGLVGPSWQAIQTHALSLASGLCGWAPLWLVAVWGLGKMARETGDRGQVLRARLELAAFAAVLLACVSLNFEGGWRVGPRYAVVVLPALALGWAAVAARALAGPPRSWAATLGLGAAAALASWSLAINGLAANLWPHFDLTNVNQPVPEVLLPLWRAGFAPYTLTGLLGAPGIGIGWIVAAAIAGALVLATPRALGVRGRAAVIVGTLAGLGLVAATRALPQHPRSAANLRYIQKVWEPPRSGAAAASERIVVR
ncbi:glycosyltransferase family 39 protein [Nannocystis radixulma]|uniref:Glycosyltransferase RgtA/B/C/D-like domain-containing protein n=1 Tax=Nannocystis radixulma TaxID=2995305 RepID=A0ABT5AZE2_9BACT|nr:hypothetical protein [Nannocystis radixulma]MDC0667201.1 hypothetical protein [Nannocystis radixulma]